MDTVTRDLVRALKGLMATHTQRADHNPACLQCENALIAITRAEHPTDAEVDRLIFDLEVFLRERRERAS